MLHFFFEEDFYSLSNQEQSMVKEKTRQFVYQNFYNRSIRLYSHSSQSSYSYIDDSVDLPLNDDIEKQDEAPTKGPLKPFMPPTKVKEDSILPFGAALDPPIG